MTNGREEGHGGQEQGRGKEEWPTSWRKNEVGRIFFNHTGMKISVKVMRESRFEALLYSVPNMLLQ